MASQKANLRLEVTDGKFYFVLDIPAGDGSGDVELFRQDVTARLSQAQKDKLAYVAER